MKKKPSAQSPAAAGLIALAALGTSALFWHVLPARADNDTAAQAAARAALLQKMRETDSATNPPAPANPVAAYGGTGAAAMAVPPPPATPAPTVPAPANPVTAYGGTNAPAMAVPAPPPIVLTPAVVVTPPPAAVAPAPVVVAPVPAVVAPAPMAVAPAPVVTVTPAPVATLTPLPPAPYKPLSLSTPPPAGATPSADATALAAFGGTAPQRTVGQPVPVTSGTDDWGAIVSPSQPIIQSGSTNPSLSILVPATVEHDEGLEHHTRGKIIEDFHADHLDLRVALALFASQNNLNIVPDNNIAGSVTLDVHNLPLDQMMDALLEASDCAWEEDNGLIRVRATETRTFVVDYLRMQRSGTGTSSATLTSATSTSSGGSASTGGGGGGGSGGSGGGSGGSGGGSGGGGGSSSGGSQDSSSMSLTENNATDFWTELRAELGALLTDAGIKTLAINKTAGIIQVTDRPSALKRVESYLMATEQSVNRQVDIETKIYDVTLNDQSQFGIDWDHVAEAYQGTLGFGTATLPVAIGSASSGLGNSALNGLNPAGGLNNIETGVAQTPTTLAFQNMNSQVALTALQTQGRVDVVAAPRIRTLNNQTAVVKVGLELPFFSQTSTTIPNGGDSALVTQNTTITTVTVGTIMSITPQISDDGWISMDISPVLTALVANEVSPNQDSTAPELTDKQASTLARVRDGTTVVLGGLIQTENDQNQNKVPVLGDLPLVGKLFTGTYHAKSKNELVIFVTPHIVEPGEPSVRYLDLPKENPSEGKLF